LERLPGTDLGEVIGGLKNDQIDRIAIEVSRAQAVVGKLGSARRYGYATMPEHAPHTTWSRVINENLTRSRRRIAANGLFDVGLVDKVQSAVSAFRHKLDVIAPTPFLHDTTTRNVIVTTEGHFSGIVDVDDLCFGDPRYPAALTLAALLASGGPTRYVSVWLQHSGRRMTISSAFT
jgi:hypothetical protein